MFTNIFRRKPELPGPETVPHVDVQKYCGTWYEVAAIPVKRQMGCTNTKAEYTLEPGGGRVLVRNSCRKNGRSVSVKATAVPVEGSGNARLVVTFFRLFKGDYWVIGLADDYSWALVTNPSRTRCWVLSRTPYPDDEIYMRMLEVLRQKGIDVSLLVRTIHD
ncbi:MAG: lipocalin family protein [Chlorobiaceae bacterium]|nr:lipocalin family protein [Chlorobiaceae bacterium]